MSFTFYLYTHKVRRFIHIISANGYIYHKEGQYFYSYYPNIISGDWLGVA